MLTIKCPKCATLMKLEQQAVAVKVKCPKCQTVLKVPAKQSAPAATELQAAAKKAAARQTARPQPTAAKQATAKQTAAKPTAGKKVVAKKTAAVRAASSPKKIAGVAAAPSAVAAAASEPNPFVDPQDNPFDALPASGLATAAAPATDGFDFGALDLSAAAPATGGFPDLGGAAATGFPAAGAASFPAAGAGSFPAAGAASFPAAASPLGNAAHPYAKPATDAVEPAAASKPKGAGGKKLLWIGVGTGAVLVLGLVVGGLVFVAKLRGQMSKSSQSAGLVDAPDGFQASNVAHVSFVVPKGRSMDKPPTSIEAKVFQSGSTGATFFVGIDEYEFLNPSPMQLSLRAGRMIMSDIWGRDSVDRDGHRGAKGTSRNGMELTDMTVEYYLVDGHVILIGCGMPLKPIDDDEDMPPEPSEPTEEEKQALEAFQAEMTTFFDSVRI